MIINLNKQEAQLLMDLHEYINDEDFIQMNEDDEQAVKDSDTWESLYKKVEEGMMKGLRKNKKR